MGRASRKKKELREAVKAGATIITPQMLEDLLATMRRPDWVDVAKPHRLLKLTYENIAFLLPESEGGQEVAYDSFKKLHSPGDSTEGDSFIYGPDSSGVSWSAWGAYYNADTDTTTTYLAPTVARKRVKVRTPYGITTREVVTDGNPN